MEGVARWGSFMTGAIPITGPQTDRARIGPVPDWVVHDPYDSPAQPEDVFVSGGRCTLLDDTQVNLSGPERCWHGRYAEKVITTAGAERAAQFSVAFDPSCETVEIHFVRVRRGPTVIDHCKPEAFEVFRRERHIERLVFDGRLTVHLVLPDVRPGDIVETSYTISGGSPILKGKHGAWIAFEWNPAMLETRHRVVSRADRPIHFRGVNGAPAPEIVESDGLVDRRWRVQRRQAAEVEDLTPPWEITAAEVQFTEFETWAEVAALFTPLYDTEQPLPEELESAVVNIAAMHTDAAERAAETLRFVQTHVRYLALSIGEGGLQPRPIETAWLSRYGDCKDAARLYVAMARRLGLDAAPALVNTRQGETLSSWLPSASAFDHCIVRVVVDDKVHWLDPTRRNQAGRLERIHHAYFGWALPLAPGVDALESMGPLAPEYIVDVRERIAFGPRPSSPAQYDWRTTYYSWRADDLREKIANEGLTDIARAYLRQVQDMWPGAIAKEPLRIEDDHEENRLTTVESYEIPAPWKRIEGARVEFASKDYFTRADLVELTPAPRRRDVHLGRPRITTRHVEMSLPADWPSDGWDLSVEAPGLKYESKLKREKKRLYTLEQRLEVQRDTMPAGEASKYIEVVAAMRKSADIVVHSLTEGDAFRGARAGWWTIAGFVIAVALGLAGAIAYFRN